jgi:hypothetical protein
MRSLIFSCAIVALSLAASCAIPGSAHSERVRVDGSVVFHFSVRGPRHSMAILNHGPGPIEVMLPEGTEHTHPVEIQVGALEYVRPGDLATLEVRHPGTGAGEIEWTVIQDLREKIRVEIR